MASMMEELTDVLKKELELYTDFIPVCRSKTKAIIKNDIVEIQELTISEQSFLDQIFALERKREEITKNIAIVMNKDYSTLNIKSIIKMLDKQPNQQEELSKLHDSLKSVTRTLTDINNQNTSLIKQSLEMIEFNMNFIQSTWMSPGNNNYDRGAKNSDDTSLYSKGMFDAKQ